MKKITSVTVFPDAVGMRMSATYSVIDDDGRIISDNQRFNRVIMDDDALEKANAMIRYAAENIPSA